MIDAVRQVLEGYKKRLEERLGQAIEASWFQFLPRFTDHILSVMIQKVSSSTSEEEPMFYPEGTKFLYRVENNCFIIVEQKPQVRTIKFLTSGERRFAAANKERYRLSFPYVVFIIGLVQHEQYEQKETAWVLSYSYCGYSNRSVKTLNDVIYSPNLPNIKNHAMCVGDYAGHPGSVSEQVERLVGHFWQGIFSKDWDEHYEKVRQNEPLLSSLEEWEANSIKNPFFTTGINWSNGASIRSILASLSVRVEGALLRYKDYFTRQTLVEAAKKAREDLADAFEGVDMEALDNSFCAYINNIVEEGEK